MTIFSVVSLAWLLSAGPVDPDTGRPLDEMQLNTSGKVATFIWHDAEDQVDGFIEPTNPKSGRPFDVSLRVRALEGEEFKGPVIITVRRAGEQQGQSVTVAQSGERWKHTFTADSSGPHQLDVGFRSSRMKVVHLTFDVGHTYFAPLSVVAFAIVSAIAVIVIGVAASRALRKKPAAA